jgi:hypothetical protein
MREIKLAEERLAEELKAAEERKFEDVNEKDADRDGFFTQQLLTDLKPLGSATEGACGSIFTGMYELERGKPRTEVVVKFQFCKTLYEA